MADVEKLSLTGKIDKYRTQWFVKEVRKKNRDTSGMERKEEERFYCEFVLVPKKTPQTKYCLVCSRYKVREANTAALYPFREDDMYNLNDAIVFGDLWFFNTDGYGSGEHPTKVEIHFRTDDDRGYTFTGDLDKYTFKLS